ncbi:hypothetical protein K438DRAFT_1966381 [Mycena galopus ATCC 62051]|nr:hypothetical protein K438DRAFT_1966381 [Mycena galopus ATCC 62051]
MQNGLFSTLCRRSRILIAQDPPHRNAGIATRILVWDFAAWTSRKSGRRLNLYQGPRGCARQRPRPELDVAQGTMHAEIGRRGKARTSTGWLLNDFGALYPFDGKLTEAREVYQTLHVTAGSSFCTTSRASGHREPEHQRRRAHFLIQTDMLKHAKNFVFAMLEAHNKRDVYSLCAVEWSSRTKVENHPNRMEEREVRTISMIQQKTSAAPRFQNPDPRLFPIDLDFLASLATKPLVKTPSFLAPHARHWVPDSKINVAAVVFGDYECNVALVLRYRE